jgi:hypothetical protein
VGLANLSSESEACVGSRVRLVGVPISFEKNFYRLPFTPPSLACRIGPSLQHDLRVGRLRAGRRGLSAQDALRLYNRPAQKHHDQATNMRHNNNKLKTSSIQDFKHRHLVAGLRPEESRPIQHWHPCQRCSSNSLHLQTLTESILRRILH